MSEPEPSVIDQNALSTALEQQQRAEREEQEDELRREEVQAERITRILGQPAD